MIAQLDALYLRLRPFKLWSRLISYGLFEGRPLTTRGRWINPLVFTLFSIEKKIPQLRQVNKPVFILGTGRSGTTVLGIVLSIHRAVGFLNEPKALWHSAFENEDLIGSYSRSNAHYRLAECDVSEAQRKSMHRLFGAYLTASVSSRVVDKYPELIFRVPFVQSIFPDAKFLFLVRNGWDTCHSIQGWSNRLGEQIGDEVHDWWGVDRRKWNLLVEQLVPEHADLKPYAAEMRNWNTQTDMAAVEWIITMREGLALLKQYPNDVLRIDYEALCVAPRQRLKDTVAFIEADVSDEIFYKYAEETLKQTPAKRPFLLHSAIEKPFLETMRQLGYEIP